jgi:hypothetical protein
MAETTSAQDATVSLLEYFGEKKRPISIERATFNELQLQIVGVFGDVLPSSSKTTCQHLAKSFIVLLKSDECEGILKTAMISQWTNRFSELCIVSCR